MTTAIARIPWRRPVILDLGPPNRDDLAELESLLRPDADQTAARHREVAKRWQRQAERRAEERPSKPEDVRLANLRWPELQRLMRCRYGVVLPDTAEARRDFALLINYAILTKRKPQLVTEIWAPWLGEDELDHIAAQRPVLHKKRDLGQKLGLLYADRHKLGILTIAPIDVDEDECERRRRQRQNERKRQKRAAAKQEEPMQTATTPDLKPKERKVLARIDAEIAVPELTRRLATLKEFKKLAEPQRQVHKILDHLVATGLIADRDEPNPHGGKVRFVWRQQ
jgi:hypothetical protein